MFYMIISYIELDKTKKAQKITHDNAAKHLR
jgi:hypothetical protein